ncbi:hypothetical protein ACP70R_016153 [Stipagrostis hirtigluma subsp. patula]
MAQAPSETKHHGLQESESHAPILPLPMREGWWAPFYLFQGCWVTPKAIKSVEVVQAQFQPRSNDIILATYPKCGTTWLKALAFTITNRSIHSVTSNNHPLLTNHPQDLVPFLDLPPRDICPLTELETLPSPRLLCTHLPLTLLPSGTLTLGCRIVYLCREPKDVLVSTWHYMNKLHQGFFIEFDKAFDYFCEGFSIYGPIWEHFLGYWKQSMIEPDRVLFLKYNEMMAEPAKHVKILAKFLHVPFTEEEESAGVVEKVVRLCSFENLKSLPVNSSGVSDRFGALPTKNSLFFRSATIGDWANHMTQEMANKLDCIIEEKLKGSGLTL